MARYVRRPVSTRRKLGALLALIAMAMACDHGPSDTPGDGGVARDGGDGGEATPALIPWLRDGLPPIAPPMLTPCPAGWNEVVDENGTTTCHPYARGVGGSHDPDECPRGEAHFVGEAGCTPAGSACPAGDFPEGLPADVPVLYVLASAPLGGDGSRARPLRTIGEAMVRAGAGTVIAVGKGEYDEAVMLREGVSLWGACAAQTRVFVSRPSGTDEAIVTVTAGGGLVKNLQLGPTDLPGLVARGASASVVVDGLLIEGNLVAALLLSAGAHVEGRELVISGTRASGAGDFGAGIVAQTASTVDLTRLVLSRNRDVAVVGSGAGTSLTLADLLVEHTQAHERDRNRGRALSLHDGVTVTVTRALLSGNRGVGVLASDQDTSVTLSDVVIEGTEGLESDGTGGRGLNVQFGAAAAVSRAWLLGNREVGVLASGDGVSVTLSDVVVDDTRGIEADGTFGQGIGVQGGATAEVTRAVLSGNRDVGVFVGGEGTSVSLSDLVVRDTLEQESDGTAGRGLSLQDGATVVVNRALISGNREVGVLATAPRTSLSLTDVVVEETRERANDGRGGQGLSLQFGATAEVSRALIAHNRAFGVYAAEEGTSATLSDLVVTDTREQSCAATTCPDEGFGVGLCASGGALTVTRFDVRASILCGLVLANDGEIDLSVGQVSGSTIGVCMQVDGYETSRLTDRVRYFDNGTHIDSTNLPLPEFGAVVVGDDAGP